MKTAGTWVMNLAGEGAKRRSDRPGKRNGPCKKEKKEKAGGEDMKEREK
jgi:hypothetical protein